MKELWTRLPAHKLSTYHIVESWRLNGRKVGIPNALIYVDLIKFKGWEYSIYSDHFNNTNVPIPDCTTVDEAMAVAVMMAKME